MFKMARFDGDVLRDFNRVRSFDEVGGKQWGFIPWGQHTQQLPESRDRCTPKSMQMMAMSKLPQEIAVAQPHMHRMD